MENVKEVFERIKFIEDKMWEYFKRHDELLLIIAWCAVLWKSDVIYKMEEKIIKSHITFLEKDLLEIRSKKIVWIKWEIK